MSFANLVETAVDSKTQLTNIEKLKYLQACIKGETARLMTSIPITDGNYYIAIDLLRDRYENKRADVQAHLQTI